jgi:hypothetical protein
MVETVIGVDCCGWKIEFVRQKGNITLSTPSNKLRQRREVSASRYCSVPAGRLFLFLRNFLLCDLFRGFFLRCHVTTSLKGWVETNVAIDRLLRTALAVCYSPAFSLLLIARFIDVYFKQC